MENKRVLIPISLTVLIPIEAYIDGELSDPVEGVPSVVCGDLEVLAKVANIAGNDERLATVARRLADLAYEIKILIPESKAILNPMVGYAESRII
jgi:hypothetical protein